MVEAMSAACKSVLRVQGRSVSMASRRLTDLSSRMLSATSQRPRERSATCRGPRRGGRWVRNKPDPFGVCTPTRRSGRAWRPRPTWTSASMVRPSRTRVSSARRASQSVPGKNAWVTCPRATSSTVGCQCSCRRMTHRPSWASQARRRSTLAEARSASRASPRQDASICRCRLSGSRAGLPWYGTGAPQPTERTLGPFMAASPPVPGNSSRRASRPVTVVASTMSQSVTPQRGPERSTCGARA